MPFIDSLAITLAALLAVNGALIPPAEVRRYDLAPKPTEPPSPDAVVARLEQLRKRADGPSDELSYFTMATDETCGYLSGVVGNPITCENDSLQCIWFTPTGSEPKGGMACVDVESEIITAYAGCIERELAQNTTVCDDICQSNTYLLRCTETSAPYCRTYAYPSNVWDYRCEKSPQARVYSAAWTWNGEEESEVGFITTTDIAKEAASLTELRTNVAEYTATKVIVVESGSSNESDGGSEGSKTPVGPIVGGVVGGLAVVGAVVLGAIYLLRHKRNTKPDEAAPQLSATHPPGAQPPAPMAESKPYVGSPAPSYSTVAPFPPPSMGSHNPSDWRGSSVMSPQPTNTVPIHQYELSSQPTDRPVSIHELAGDHNNMH